MYIDTYLLAVALWTSHLNESGFRSFAYTLHLALAAGIAKGPTPQKTSATMHPDLKRDTMRRCSVARRELKYT